MNYAVIGTFVNSDNDIVLDYFETMEEATEFASQFEDEELDFITIYKIQKGE